MAATKPQKILNDALNSIDQLMERGIFKKLWHFVSSNTEIIDGEVHHHASIKKVLLSLVVLAWFTTWVCAILGVKQAVDLMNPVNVALGIALGGYAGTKILHSGPFK